MRDSISASFAWTEHDDIAAYRASRMIRDVAYDSVIKRTAFLLFGHLFAFTGVLILALAIAGQKGANGPIPPSALVINGLMSLVAAYYLFTRWYGFRWVMRRAFRSSKLADGLKTNYVFTPQQVETTNRLAESRRRWESIDRVVEFRDGFVIEGGATYDWIPKYAFTNPFDDVEFSGLARSSGIGYKSIDRCAALTSRRPPRSPTPSQG